MRDIKYDINNPRPLPSQHDLVDFFDYNWATGDLTWKKCNVPELVGLVAGTKQPDGYIGITFNGVKYKAHRLIFMLEMGYEPFMVDHINGNRSDNRLLNLRAVDSSENAKNCSMSVRNKSGVTGVFYHKGQDKYHSSIRVERKSYHIGSYPTLEEAKAARKAVEKFLGFSARHGVAA